MLGSQLKVVVSKAGITQFQLLQHVGNRSFWLGRVLTPSGGDVLKRVFAAVGITLKKGRRH